MDVDPRLSFTRANGLHRELGGRVVTKFGWPFGALKSYLYFHGFPPLKRDLTKPAARTPQLVTWGRGEGLNRLAIIHPTPALAQKVG